ncbi:hypothetical protein OF83DRAFT_1130196 [Amylostereum chailletii]|nr:hypothetical protein OF83DRAFT_1130196 [Amylostereum chailletii]
MVCSLLGGMPREGWEVGGGGDADDSLKLSCPRRTCKRHRREISGHVRLPGKGNYIM